MRKRIIAVVLIFTMVLDIFKGASLVYAQEIFETKSEVVIQELEMVTETTSVEEAEEPSTGNMYNDLVISSNYVLQSDLDVNNLIVNSGIFDLNGYQLNVYGNIEINGGVLKINGGVLDCQRDFTCSYCDGFYMNSVNDYFCVKGDFEWNAGNASIDNGIIEVKGNFIDNSEQGFVTSNNNRVLLSGTTMQELKVTKSTKFNTLELQNESEEGVFCNNAVVAKEISSNDSKFSYAIEGEKGWILEQDEILEGDLILVSDELNLNGNNLTINGNLILMSGNIYLNGGKLNVNGDFRIQSIMYNEGVEEYGYSGGNLIMTNEVDEVHITGDFVMGSVNEHSEEITNGKMYVGGNFSQITYGSNKNFAASGNHEVIFVGNAKQEIKFDNTDAYSSHFGKVSFQNESEEGIVLMSEICIMTELQNTISNITGYVSLNNSATLHENYYKGDIKLLSGYNLLEDTQIEGNLYAGSILNLNGHMLKVEGNVHIHNGNIYVSSGTLECMGDFSVTSEVSSVGYLLMNNVNDYVLVHGNLNWSTEYGYYNTLTAGILELKGDFNQIVSRYEDNFVASGSHKVILSGDKKQIISFQSAKSYFNIVELINDSEEGIWCSEEFNCSQLIKNDCEIHYAGEGTQGWTLQEDMVFEGDMILVGDELNLNGHKLVIEGSLIQEAGTVNINNGSLVIRDDYRIQKEQEDGSFGKSNGILIMTNEQDEVHVAGDFVMGSVNGHDGRLTNGKLYVGGNFSQITYYSSQNFAATANHETIFDGEVEQEIKFDTPSHNASRFAKVTFQNESEAGIKILSSVLVMTELQNRISNVTGFITLHPTARLFENYYKGDLTFDLTYYLPADMYVEGNLYTGTGVYLNGHKLIVVGNANIHNGYIFIGHGTFECEGDVNVTSSKNVNSYIQMIYDDDYVLVHGNFNWSSYMGTYDVLRAGTMELKGDFTQTVTFYKDNFVPCGTHKVILSGDRKQTITLQSALSYFNIVELQNRSEEGVYIPYEFNYKQFIKNGCRVQYGKEGTQGWILENDMVFEGSMHLIGDELNLNGHELVIEGDLIHEAGNININNGRLIVNGDYRIQSVKQDDGAYISSSGKLVMTNEKDEVHVHGNFVMGSANGHETCLTNGKLYISGNFEQIAYYSQQNFTASENHETIFIGNEKQVIAFGSAAQNASGFAKVTFQNESEEGIVISGIAYVRTELQNTISNVTGEMCLCGAAKLYENYYKGNICITSGFNMTADMHIAGNLNVYAGLHLDGHKLVVEGDTQVYCSYIYINGGVLECQGDLNVTAPRNMRSYLQMQNTDDYILVHGNLNWNTGYGTYDALTAGTMELKGDFIQTITCFEDSFVTEKSHKVILSGERKQTITLQSVNSYFNILEIQNYSVDGIYISDVFNAAELITNNCKLRFSDNSVMGWTLKSDTVIAEDLVLFDGTLDLNGNTLTVEGDFIQKGGEVCINNGTLIVNGDYRIQTTKNNADGSIAYDCSTGILIMRNDNDRLVVHGDFVTSSTVSHKEMLTNGVMEVKGNFVQNKTVVDDNFAASGKFVLRLNGSQFQNITVTSSGSSYVSNIEFCNTSESGVHITNPLYITENISDLSHNVTGWIQAPSVQVLTNGYFSGNIKFTDKICLTSDLKIGGSIEINYDFDVNGKKVNADEIIVNYNTLILNGGTINCIGDFTICNQGSLVMNNSLDRIIVGGDFASYTIYSEEGKLTDGLIEIKGDFLQTASAKSFVASNNHKVVLSGKTNKAGRVYKQTIQFADADNSGFNILVLTKPEDYYYFDKEINSVCNELIVNVRDMEAPSVVTKLAYTDKTASEITLSWGAATDNVGILGYEIYRDNEKVATVVTNTYTDKNLMPQKAYTYKVCALDEAGNLSEYSKALTIVTNEDKESPSVPGALSIKNRSGSSITLRWNPSTDNVKCAGYRIFRDDVEIAVVYSGTSYKDTDVILGKEYVYQVKAFDEAGNESDLSEAVSGFVVMPSITGVYPGNNSILGGEDSVQIEARFLNTGNSIKNKVKFEYSLNQTDWYAISSNLSGQRPYSVMELCATQEFYVGALASGEYTIRVTLYDEDNNTVQKELTYIIDNEAPEKVSDFTGVSNQGVTELNWSISHAADCESYCVYRKEKNESEYQLLAQIEGRENTFYLDKELAEGKLYEYYVTALDALGNESVISEIVEIKAEKDDEMPSVVEISITQEKATQMTPLTIKAKDNVEVVMILLQYYDEEKDLWIDIDKEKAEDGCAVIEWNTIGLKEGTYTIRALAYDKSQNVSNGNYHKTIIVDNQGPAKIQITEVIPYSTHVSIHWEDVKDEDFAYFQVEQFVDGEYISVGTENNALGMHVTQLKPQTEYIFRVTGVDSLGNRGQYSEVVKVTTLVDDVKPYITLFSSKAGVHKDEVLLEVQAKDNDAVKEALLEYSYDQKNWETIAIVTDECGYVHLSWNTNDEDISYYMIYRSEEEQDVFTLIEDNYASRNYFDANVLAGKTYVYKIRCVDKAGNISEDSKAVTITATEDDTLPVIYGFIPGEDSAIGDSTEIGVVAFDAGLQSVLIEYKKADGDEIWYQLGEMDSINTMYEKVAFAWNTKGLEEGTYRFRAMATDNNGNVSNAYETTYILDKTAPKAPEAELEQANFKINLKWTSSECDDLAYYRILRKSAMDAEYTVVTTINDTEYTDESVTPMLAYSYKIEAWDTQGNYSESEPISGYAYMVDDIAPEAVLPKEMFSLTGLPFKMDGAQSSDNVRITEYAWNMGNGDIIYGVQPEYAYEKAGTYSVELTVSDAAGNKNSTRSIIYVYDGLSYGSTDVYVVNQDNEAIPYAYVFYNDADGVVRSLKTDKDGKITIAGMPGTQKIAVYQQGYTPQEYNITINNAGKSSSVTICLNSSEFIIGELKVHRMSLEEMLEAGIDFKNPENYHRCVIYFDLKFEQKKILVSSQPISIQWPSSAGGGNSIISPVMYYEQGGGSIQYQVILPKNFESEEFVEQPIYAYLSRVEEITWLKDIFWVELGIVNQASEIFYLDGCSAEISLPEGLSLEGTKKEQSTVKEIGVIPGGQKGTASWYLRGDVVGDYSLQASFKGTLMPFNAPVSACFETKEDFRVTSGEGVLVKIMPEMDAYIDEHYFVQYEIVNQSDHPIYNLKTSFGITKLPEPAVEIQLIDKLTGKATVYRESGAVFYCPDANKSTLVPVVMDGETIVVGVLQPGESVYGTFMVKFEAEGDKDEVFYKLIDAKVGELTESNTNITIKVAPIQSHMQKMIIRYSLIDYLWGDPVDMTTGAFTESINLMSLSCDPALSMELNYSSVDSDLSGECGYGWNHNFESYIKEEYGTTRLYLTPYTYLTFLHEDSIERKVTGEVSGGYINIQGKMEGEADYLCLNAGMDNYTLHRNADGSYCMTIKDDQSWEYDNEGKLIRMTYVNGKSVEVTYGSNWMQITEPDSGMYLKAYYNGAGQMVSVEDNAGRRTMISYEDNCIVGLINPLGENIRFTYDENHRLISGYNNEGVCYVTNTYDALNRVVAQDDADGETPLTFYSYEVDEYGKTVTTATDRNGGTIEYRSDALGRITSITDQNGGTVSYTYNEDGVSTSETGACGDTISYVYDEEGHLIKTIEPDGAITAMEYDVRDNVSKVTTANQGVNTFLYDDRSLLIEERLASGVMNHYTYDTSGRILTQETKGLGTTRYTYDKGLVTRIQNANGAITKMEYDAMGNMTSVITADGAITNYTYDALGRQTSVQYADGGMISYTYDNSGNTTSITDQNGNKVFFEYNDNGWLTKSTNTLSGVTLYEYDNEGRIICRTNPDKTQVKSTYDGEGNVLSTIDEEGNEYHYEYDKLNRLITEMTPNGAVTRYEYNADGTRSKVIYPDGSYLTYAYDKMGNLINTTDNSGNIYHYEYDVAGNLNKITNPLGGMVFYEYDIYGRMLSSTDANGNTMQYEYDAMGNCIKQVNAMSVEAQMEYDIMSRLKSVSVKTDRGDYRVSYTYDAMGRVVSFTDEEGATIYYEYDLLGNVVSIKDSSGSVVESASYDAAGNLTTTTNALSVSTQYTYDACGNLISTIANQGTASETVTKYGYDALGRLTMAVDGEGGESSYTYDSMGNIVAVKDPNGGVNTYEYDLMGRITNTTNAVGSTKEYVYNAQGLLAEAQNSRGQTTTYTYDALGRIISMSDEAGTIRYTYDSNGNVLTVSDEKGTITREYDALNRVTSYTDYRGQTVKYSYDELGNLIALTYPGGKIVRYEYYKNGLLKKITDWNGRITSYQYNNAGLLEEIRRPDGSTEIYEYDAAGQLLRQTDKNGEKVIQCITYAYDESGNVTSMSGTNTTERNLWATNITMEYDEANRLIRYNGEEVKYDADGNMIYGPLNGTMTEFAYDCRNRLISAGTTAYEYDAENHRIAVTTEDSHTEYIVEDNASTLSQVLVAMEYEVRNGSISGGGKKTYYVYGNGLLAQEDEEGGENTYLTYHYNNIGSTTVLTDKNGEAVQVFSYGVYGELLSGNTDHTQFLYNGRYGVMTDKNGLCYMRARYYNVDIKRFINQDVLTGSITDSSSLNRYAYCEGNPVNQADPFGLSPTITWSDIVHGTLDILGFTPIVGGVFDIANAYLYAKEGRYGMMALSIISALPFAGDVAGFFTKKITKCAKYEKILKFSTRFVSYGANAVLGTYESGRIVVELFKKHVIQHEEWDINSTLQLVSAVFFAGSAAFSYKGLYDEVTSFSATMNSIKTAYCFMEGTLVVTRDGNVPIEELEPGDYVLAYNEKTGETAYKQVLRLFRNTTDEIVHVEVNGEEILTTPGHKFYVEGEWIAARELEEGNKLTLVDGRTVEVERVTLEKLDSEEITYNFEVEEWHTYFVSEDGVLVHNMNNGCGVTGESGNSSTEIKEVFNSIKDSPNYPDGFQARKNGTTSNKVNNQSLLEKLREIESGTWKKVYKDGYDTHGNEISIHYFQSQSGKVFNVKVKSGWSN